MEYVIIGNGIAGISAARAIRDQNPEGHITILGEENVFPYNRIMLSKQLLNVLNPDTMLLQSRDWYKEMQIRMYNSSRATAVDFINQQVICDDGEIFPYDRLLIATGAKNRVPPVAGIDSPGVFSIRQLADVEAMQDTLQSSQQVALIGGGIQNLETAWTLVQKGKKVLLVGTAQRLMPRLLDEEASQILMQGLTAAGVEMHLGVRMETIEEGTPLRCTLSSGAQIVCDLVVYATGIVPRAELAAGTPLSAGDGIGVDAYLRTAVPNIYAAGDVTQCQGMVCGLWNTAAVQGKIAGLNMTGSEVIYTPVLPVTTLNAFGVSLFSMGQPFARESGWSVAEQGPEVNRYVRVFCENDRLVGAIVMGDRRLIPALMGAIEKQTRVPLAEKADRTLADVLALIS